MAAGTVSRAAVIYLLSVLAPGGPGLMAGRGNELVLPDGAGLPRESARAATGACCIGNECLGPRTEEDCGVLMGYWYEGFDCTTFVCLVETGSLPEDHSRAYPMPSLPFSAAIYTRWALPGAPPGTCNKAGVTQMQNDVWFVYTPPQACSVELTVAYGLYTGLTVVRAGPTCATSIEIFCLNADPPDGEDRDTVSFPAAAGTTYWFQIGKWGANSGGGMTLFLLQAPTPRCPGDMNCDGRITFTDIDLFVESLGGESAWVHSCRWLNADCNRDGRVTFADIDPFVALIGTTCP